MICRLVIINHTQTLSSQLPLFTLRLLLDLRYNAILNGQLEYLSTVSSA